MYHLLNTEANYLAERFMEFFIFQMFCFTLFLYFSAMWWFNSAAPRIPRLPKLCDNCVFLWTWSYEIQNTWHTIPGELALASIFTFQVLKKSTILSSIFKEITEHNGSEYFQNSHWKHYWNILNEKLVL